MNIADSDTRDARLVHLYPCDLGRVFEQTVAGQLTAIDSKINLADLRIERTQRHIRDRVLRAGSRERLFEKVGVAVDCGATVTKDHETRVKTRRISIVRCMDVANVVRGKVEICQM